MNIDVGDIGVNVTILIQMTNFWVAYAVLRFFLFSPAYRELTAEQRAHDKVSQSIASAESELAQFREKQRDLWRECREHCMREQPDLQRDMPAIVPEPLQRQMLEKQEVDALRSTVKDYVVDRLAEDANG